VKERQIIDLIRNLVEEDDPDVVVPLGDDAACIRHEGELLLTVDCFYEGVHFDTGFFEASDIGWKCAAATLSDIAAMGGRPLYSLLSLGFSSEPDATVVRELMEGFNSMVGSYSCRLVGGDVYRPAAIEQLKVLGEQINVPVYTEEGNTDPVKIAQAAIKEAKRQGNDVVIIDTFFRIIDCAYNSTFVEILRIVQRQHSNDGIVSCRPFINILNI